MLWERKRKEEEDQMLLGRKKKQETRRKEEVEVKVRVEKWKGLEQSRVK